MDDSGTTASFAEEDELYRLAEQRGLATSGLHQGGFDAMLTRDVFFSLPDSVPPAPRATGNTLDCTSQRTSYSRITGLKSYTPEDTSIATSTDTHTHTHARM